MTFIFVGILDFMNPLKRSGKGLPIWSRVFSGTIGPQDSGLLHGFSPERGRCLVSSQGIVEKGLRFLDALGGCGKPISSRTVLRPGPGRSWM
jgi:hypothetical protein